MVEACIESVVVLPKRKWPRPMDLGMKELKRADVEKHDPFMRRQDWPQAS